MCFASPKLDFLGFALIISVAIFASGTIGSPMSLSPTETVPDECSLLSFGLEDVTKDTEDSLKSFVSDRIVTTLQKYYQ